MPFFSGQNEGIVKMERGRLILFCLLRLVVPDALSGEGLSKKSHPQILIVKLARIYSDPVIGPGRPFIILNQEKIAWRVKMKKPP